MMISLKKQILKNIPEQQINCITNRNGKTEYRGRINVKKEFVLQPGWIMDAFELSEPELYKLVKTVTYGDESQTIYTVPIGKCNQQTSDEEYKYEEKLKSELIVPGEYISKKEPSKISENKTIRLYIVPVAPT